MTRSHRVNRPINRRRLRSRPSRTTIYTAVGTVFAASAAATGVALIPADSTRHVATAAGHGRLTMTGDVARAGDQAATDQTARELRDLRSRAQAAARVRVIRRHRAAVHAAAVRAADVAAAARREAAEHQAAQRQATRSQAAQSAAAPPPAASSGSPQQIAMSMLAQFGWSSSQFSCLDPLWERESGWNPAATNPYSGAYGIPQALPGSKMASAGADWETNPATQIRWGLEYIKATYGSPCAAWSHETADGSY